MLLMKRLLVCTDGSAYSQECCRYAAWLAQQDPEIEILALYVTDLRQFEVPAVADLSGSLGIQPFDGMIAQLQEVEEIKAKFVEEQASKVFQEADIKDRVTFQHDTGLLVDAIAEYTADIDLILLGKRGENANFATEHLGSMLERVVRSASKPCLVTTRTFKPFTRVAIAYDGGESCQKALEYLSELSLFESLDLHVITVVEGHHEDLAASRLTDAEAQLNANGLQPTYQVLSGNVEEAISNYVTSASIDLLVMGAYGHSRIRELLIGSTTTELLRRCHVPVLCLR